MCNNPEVLTHDWIKTGGRSVLVNGETGQVGPGTNFTGNPTNRALALAGLTLLTA